MMNDVIVIRDAVLDDAERLLEIYTEYESVVIKGIAELISEGVYDGDGYEMKIGASELIA